MSDETNENVDRDELHDRLIDRGLREVVGGEKPSQLAARILAAAGVASAAEAPTVERAPEHAAATSLRRRFGWLQIALAACLLIGAGVGLLLPAQYSARESARRGASGRVAAPLPAPARPATTDGELDDRELSYGLAGDEKLAKPISENQELESRKAQVAAQQAGSPLAADDDGIAPTFLGIRESTSAATETRSADDALADQPAVAAQEPFGVNRTLRENGIAAQPAISESLAFLSQEGGGEGQQAGEQQQGNGQQGSQPSNSPNEMLRSDLAERNVTRNYYLRHLSDAEGQAPGLQAQGAAPAFPYTADLDIPFRQGSFGLGERGVMERDFMLMVTPRIIIQEEEEERLGLDIGSEQQHGRGPQAGGDQYAPIVDNPFHAINAATTDNRLSTFSIDVDTASYANVRQFLMQSNTLPPPDAVRIEELVNYFDYDYSAPTGDVPFAANVEVAACPWQPEHRLVRVGIKGREMERTARPKSNLVFLVDVSGSMDEPNKLPLVVEGLRMLTRQLGENDRIAIVVYASREGLVLESTRGDQQRVILDALNRLSAGGSTAGGAGIVLAYQLAEQNFIKDGVNRVILCTDGDFNVGVTSTGDLQRLAEDKAKNTGVFLTVLGFGRGNLNDAMMEAIANHGNGNYHYVDNRTEARKVLVEEMTGTLVTIAKDVKIQIEFNPAAVAGYRLIGYENRMLAAEDFNDDKKDAGEIGAGHTVTALYEIVPVGKKVNATAVDALKYAPVAPQHDGEAASAAARGGEEVASAGGGDAEPAGGGDAQARNNPELLTLKIRYKQPDGDVSTKLEFPVTDNAQAFSEATADFQFASAVAGFGMLLRGSPHKGNASFAGMLEIAESASRDRDQRGYRGEFCDLIRRAKELAGY